MRDPETNEEWKEAVNGAAFLLLLDSCRQYGLVETDVAVDVQRCEEILADGKARGFVPDPTDTLIESYLKS